jgi:hypothetical protein
MNSIDFRDFYIKYPDHPNYNQSTIDEDDIIYVILQKYEMILFTNQGEVLGDPKFGCNLLELLYQTKVSGQYVEGTIRDQITIYIPELNNMNYELQVVFTQDPYSFQDMMFIYFKIADYEVYTQIGNQYGIGF